MKEMKRWLKALVAVASAALVLAACGNNNEEAGDTTASVPRGDDNFTYVVDGDPESLNPLNTTGRGGLTFDNIVYSPLFRILPDGTIDYVLATEAELADDGETIHVTLRDDVQWSDGEPFSADDVVFTYTEKAKRENGNADNLIIGGEPIVPEKIDDTHVDFHLPEKSAAALENISLETFVIPKHIFEQEPDLSTKQPEHEPVGTGPYTLEEYKPGEYLRFKANPHYVGGEVGIPSFTLRIIQNRDTVKTALQKGEIDAAFVLPEDVEDLDQATLNIYPYNENHISYLGLNTKYPALQNKQVRQALFYALDQESIDKASYLDEDYYDVPHTVLPSENVFADEDASPYHYDPEKAKQLLAESGETDLHLTLAYDSSNPVQTTQTALIQEQLNAVGFDVELHGGDASEYLAEARDPDSTKYALFMNGYIFGADPDSYKPLFHSGGTINYFKHYNDKTDELFADGVRELDPDKRKEIYSDWQRNIMEEAFIYPLSEEKKILVVNKRVDGIEDASPIAVYTLKDWAKLSLNAEGE